MVNKFFARANRRLTITSAASLLAASSLVSFLLGFYRERLLVSGYYNTYPTAIDAYKVAFTVPDFMFFILVSGALSVTFIPVFNERLANSNKKSAWELSSSLMNVLAITTMLASIGIIIFAEPLVRFVIAPGLDESTRSLAVSMMRVIAVNPFLFAISSVLSSMQQAVGRFFFFALAPIFYSVGIIIGALFLVNGVTIFGVQIFGGGIMGVALGVVLGSILQLIVSSIGMYGMGFEYQFKIFWRNLGFRRVLRLLPPRSVDQGIDYFNNLVEINLASRLAEGAITAYQESTILYMAPVTLIGVAISTAAFPKMTERVAKGETHLFRTELQTILRVIVWLALPAMVVAFLGRGYLVNFLDSQGGDQRMADILGILSLGIVFRSIYQIASRSFYAQQDTKTPLYISLFTIGFNIVLAVWFVTGLGFGVFGLAAAQSIVALTEVMILFSIMSSRIKGLFDTHFLHGITRMIIAAGLMFIVTYVAVKVFVLRATDTSLFVSIPRFSLIALIGLVSYLFFSWLLRLQEARPVLAQITKLMFRNFGAPEQ